MAAQYTPNLNLLKPGTDDNIGVESSLSENFQNIDDKVGNSLKDHKNKTWETLGERLNAEATAQDATDAAVKVLETQLPNAVLDDGFIRAIVNRGASSQAPENTLPAFRWAVDMGFWGIYTSVQMTSTGAWVCIHDTTVDRTSNGTGAVSSKTLGDLNALDFGSWYSVQYKDTKIATVQLFLQTCRLGGVVPYIEIKGGSYTDVQIEGLLNIIKSYGFANGCAVTSYNLDYLKKVRLYDKTIALGLMTSDFTQTNVNDVKALGNAFISAAGSKITSATMAMAKGLRVEAFTINSNNDLRNYIKLGVRAAMTTRIPFGRGY
ncbi:glycerophosphodiester phosphodiesterase family protein [Metabacillus dongyingensis]|uniref:glycerophosphodiester phosphodiesterase n=1 Tax=Metabacillus dongyingensis TaxID=2874282 RepID=UPI003B8CE0FD